MLSFRTTGFCKLRSSRRKGWLAAMLIVALSAPGVAQRAAQQPPANQTVGTGEKADKSTPAAPAPTGTALDPSAIPVIKTLLEVPKAFDPTKSVNLLKGNSPMEGVMPLLDSLNGDQKVADAEKILTSGKKYD